VPLIAPVDTITPVPLLYHIRTFYIVRYNSPTTHPSQPTYTINELQKKKKKQKQGGRKRLGKETKEDKQKEKRKERKKNTTNALTNSDQVQLTHTNNYKNNYDPYIHYQQTNTSLQTTFHILDILQNDNTHSKHNRQQDNTRSKHDKIKQKITILQIITIPTFNLNKQIDHFKTTFHNLNTLPTYK